MRELIALAVLVGSLTFAEAQEATIRVGAVRSLSSIATVIGVEKGYYKDAGVNVEIETLGSSGDAMALISQNRLQVVEGGISAAYFNALAKDLPVIITNDRVSSPVHHELIVRSDLKDEIKSLKDLKGRTITANSRGAVNNYEIAKLLETVGLTLKDVEVKYIPFGQVAVALANKAVDAAMLVPPFGAQAVEKGFGFVLADSDDYIKPNPIVISVSFMNTDWAKANPDVARRYMVGYMRAVRDYCQAYHGGSNRAEIIDIAVRSGIERNRDVIDNLPWPARTPDGRVNVGSTLDLQKFYKQMGLIQQEFPAEKLVDTSLLDEANAKLGPFVLENKDSKLSGCR